MPRHSSCLRRRGRLIATRRMLEADAQHREALALAAEQRQTLAADQTAQLLELLHQNTQLTELVKELSQRIEVLTLDLHDKVVRGSANA